jgi:hypothetical protein
MSLFDAPIQELDGAFVGEGVHELKSHRAMCSEGALANNAAGIQAVIHNVTGK